MTASKTIFLTRDKDLAQWWSAIAHHENFDQVLLYARSEFMDGAANIDQMRGGKDYERIIKTLGDVEDSPAPALVPVSPINHDILNNPRYTKPKVEPPKPTP